MLFGGGGRRDQALPRRVIRLDCVARRWQSTAMCASTRFGTRSPIFRKSWCLLFVLYSCFHVPFAVARVATGRPLSLQQLPPTPCVVMCPPLPSLFIIPCTYCVYYTSLLFYFIFRSHLSVRACRRLASVSWCCALRRNGADFCIRRQAAGCEAERGACSTVWPASPQAHHRERHRRFVSNTRFLRPTLHTLHSVEPSLPCLLDLRPLQSLSS